MRLLDYDKFSGTTSWFDYDHNDKTFSIHREQDIEPELEAGKALANDDDYWKKGVKKGWAHYGHIPTTIMESWLKQGVNINDTKELFKLINKPEYQYLRVTSKRHG